MLPAHSVTTLRVANTGPAIAATIMEQRWEGLYGSPRYTMATTVPFSSLVGSSTARTISSRLTIRFPPMLTGTAIFQRFPQMEHVVRPIWDPANGSGRSYDG